MSQSQAAAPSLEVHRVYRSLGERFTLLGYSMPEAVCLFMAFNWARLIGILPAILAVIGLLVFFGYAHKRDPKFFEIMMRRRMFRALLDAGRGGERPL